MSGKPADIIEIPVLFDTYRPEKQLGSGSCGIVYKAWHIRLQKHVVIKVVRHNTHDAVEARRNEIEALKYIRSLYVPRVLDFLTEGELSYTIMEYIGGESFDKLLERQQVFSENRIVKWYGELASALTAIHKLEIYHCDIKPANTILSPDDDIYLIDFNAALVSGNDTKLISCSPGYASPEQYELFQTLKYAEKTKTTPHGSCTGCHFSDNKKDTRSEYLYTEFSDSDRPFAGAATDDIDWRRSDIFSLGAAMYHLLSGVKPAGKAEEIIPVSQLGGYGEGISYIIERSMNTDPAGRFANAEELSGMLRKLTGALRRTADRSEQS